MNKMKLRKLCSLMLSLCLMLALAVPAFAATPDASDTQTITSSGAQGSVPVTLTTADGGLLTFKVTLPTTLPAVVDAANRVTTATNARITNLSAGPVEVSNLRLSTANGWSVADWGTDLSNRPVGDRTIALEINGLESDADASNYIRYNQRTFMREIRNATGDDYLWAADYSRGYAVASRYGSMGIDYDVDIAPQGRTMRAETALCAVFTVGFCYA